MTEIKTALIVEDSLSQALACRLLLEKAGMRVLWAENGQVGVQLAAQLKPDVIIMDIEMPEMNGIEATRLIKENPETAYIPVVLLTVRTEMPFVIDGINVGALDFVPKDVFSPQVLLQTLHQLGLTGAPEDQEFEHEA